MSIGEEGTDFFRLGWPSVYPVHLTRTVFHSKSFIPHCVCLSAKSDRIWKPSRCCALDATEQGKLAPPRLGCNTANEKGVHGCSYCRRGLCP